MNHSTTINTLKTILFFGTEDFSAFSLQALIDAGYTIGAVITKPDSKKGRGRSLTPPRVKTIALDHSIPVWQPTKIADIAHNIAEFDHPIGVLVSFGKIIPQSIIDCFTPGIINVHPSLLPQYRGPSPIESAIKNGDSVTGVSIMQLSAAMDAGPVYTQEIHKLTGSETRPELYNILAKKGAALLLSVLDAIIDISLLPQPQNDEVATYSQLLKKEDGIILPETMEATTIERLVRAYQGYPKTRLSYHGNDCIITKTHVTTKFDETVITCAQESLLAIDELIAPSGKTMTAQAYLRGLRRL